MCAVRWLSVLRVPHVSTLSTRSVHLMRARVRSATPQSSSPPYSIRGLVFRRGVHRGPGNFAGDPSVPSDEAHGAPPGQGPLHRTPAYPRTNDKTATQCPRRRGAHTPTSHAHGCTRACRHAGLQTYDGRVFAHLLHRAEKPALRHGPCRSKPGPTRQAEMADLKKPYAHSHLGTPT